MLPVSLGVTITQIMTGHVPSHKTLAQTAETLEVSPRVLIACVISGLNGAGDRDRTGTGLSNPRDFKSLK